DTTHHDAPRNSHPRPSEPIAFPPCVHALCDWLDPTIINVSESRQCCRHAAEPSQRAQSRVGGVTGVVTTGVSGSGVKSSPGVMNRSCSKWYCLSYSWR